MKRKSAHLIGNVLMGLGMVVMIGSIGVNLFSHVINFGLSELVTNGSLFGIFVGAMVWLVGARVGGREKVADRYWVLKHYGRKDNHRYP
ncbi:stress-induced protein YchH [Providencia rettgeri]|uniref:stress-induced protein YchH n=1 Tax=Providencia sp. TaxID=589 RepID=UPI0024ABF8E5|nr:stress-induced protein YchH [Providencia rettgeri]